MATTGTMYFNLIKYFRYMQVMKLGGEMIAEIQK